MFGNSPDVGKNSDEIMIAVPAWNNMEMEVVGNTCSGNRANIAADIKAIGARDVLSKET